MSRLDTSIPSVAAVEIVGIAPRVVPALAVHGAAGVHDESPFAIVRVHASDGAVGHGEVSATPIWSGEDSTTAAYIVRSMLRDALVGQPLTPIAALAARMDRAVAGHSFTKAGVSAALWDAFGRSAGLPVATLLGGPFRRDVPVKLSLSGRGDALESSFAGARAIGFESFKLKVGFDPDADAAGFAHARHLVGDDAFLGMDANQGWTRGAAVRAMELTRALRPGFVEQPVAADDLEGMRALRGSGTVILADESVYSIGDLVRLVRADAADAVSVYVGKSGGLERAVHQGRIATAFGLQVVIGSNGETDLGAAAQLHVACAIEGLSATIPSDIIGSLWYLDPTTSEPLRNDGRRAVLPDGPGLGVEPSPEIQGFA